MSTCILTPEHLEVAVMHSELEIKLTKQGCRFQGQELLANHEEDPNKPCYCGRPFKNKKMRKTI